MDFENNYEDKSAWSEQKVFANTYFDCSKTCRQMQFQGDLIGWKSALDTKTVHGIPILKEDDQRKWYAHLEELDKAFNLFFHHKIELRKSAQEMYPTNNHYIEFKKKLQKYEIDFDTEINKVMPFLFVKKKIDIAGL